MEQNMSGWKEEREDDREKRVQIPTPTHHHGCPKMIMIREAYNTGEKIEKIWRK
jgi:hypothetical protein